MNDAAIKNYCMWARREVIAGVEARMRLYGIAEDAEPTGSTTVAGRALSPQECEQRDDLLRAAQVEGFDHLRDRAAYTWFNRIAAVRYMEVHDFLPSRVRMFTRPAADGSWELGSQAVDEALDIEIEGVDPACVMELKQTGEDEPLFRYLFLAQCDELAGCMPDVFQPVDACMALLLPANLMDAEGVIGHMVTDIDKEDWNNVQLLGWMYQYYNAERKIEVDAAVKKGKKVYGDDLAPKTQLFTPEWIVRYMVENSLGRLWMLNNPESDLREQMDYYIEPDAEHEDFIHIDGPEDITFCDPACGSAHILVYAFELLFAMYEERGYLSREIPELILTKNLAGMEIDPRAAQIAGLALAMCARERDRRFFKRDVSADITVLKPIAFGEGELPEGCSLAKKKDLLGALEHLDEVGSLLAPDEDDLAAIHDAIDLCEQQAGGLFANNTVEKLTAALVTCEKLACRFTCVVANPPYLGSSAFDPFMSKWIKKNYPDVKSDLCTCFITRVLSLSEISGFTGLATSNSWMFLSSYEKLRQQIVDNKTIDSLVQLSVHGFHGIAAQVCTFVLRNRQIPGYHGGYVRLNDFDHWTLQESKTLEAIKNPDCGWFYRRNAETFKQIPGTPIAFWIADGLVKAFENGIPLGKLTDTHLGMATCDNEKFLRLWWEVGSCRRAVPYQYPYDFSSTTWVPYNKGGIFRKWDGNDEYVVNWSDNGAVLQEFGAVMINESLRFKPMFSWTRVSSGSLAVRIKRPGYMFDMTGPAGFGSEDQIKYNAAFLNSSIGLMAARFLSASLDFQPGQIAKYPIISDQKYRSQISALVDVECAYSKSDWDTFETSWDFKRHPLV